MRLCARQWVKERRHRAYCRRLLRLNERYTKGGDIAGMVGITLRMSDVMAQDHEQPRWLSVARLMRAVGMMSALPRET